MIPPEKTAWMPFSHQDMCPRVNGLAHSNRAKPNVPTVIMMAVPMSIRRVCRDSGMGLAKPKRSGWKSPMR